MNELPNMVNEVDAAKILGGSRWTLRKWRSNGQGPAYHKRGGRIFYDVEDLRKWIIGVRVDPTAGTL